MTAGDGLATQFARLRGALVVVLGLCAGVVALWPSPRSLLAYWSQIADYQHGFLIAALTLGWLGLLLWRGAARDAQASPAGAAALAAVLLGWIVAVRGGIDVMHQVLWPLLLLLGIWAVAGLAVARRLAAPVGLLWFAVPIWDYGLPVLQGLSIFFSEHILRLLGVPAIVSEYRVTIPAGTFEIVEGCSGKRYFVVTLAVACLAAAINHLRGWRLPVFIAAAGALAMLANWLRIVIVIYAGHATDMRHYFVAIEHESLGHVVFGVLLVGVLWLGRWMAAKGAPPASRQAVASAAAGARRFPAAAGLVALSLLLALSAWLARGLPHLTAGAQLAVLPIATGTWQGPLPPRAGWSPHFAGADDLRRVVYTSASGDVEVYANLYQSQPTGHEMIQYGNNLVAPDLWTAPWSGRSESVGTGRAALVLRRMQGPDQRPWLLAFQYRVGARSYRSELAAKLAYGWQSLFRPAPSGIIALASACDLANCDQARARLAGFWEDMSPSLAALMPAGAGPKP